MEINNKEIQKLLHELELQIISVIEMMEREPSKKKRILINLIANYYEIIKKTVKKHGNLIPHYFIVADMPYCETAAVTDDVVSKAKKLNADAIISVDGFISYNDISDVIYHVSMSAVSVGVCGWVFKVKSVGETIDIVQELPYLFDSPDKVKSLGKLIKEMEGNAGK